MPCKTLAVVVLLCLTWVRVQDVRGYDNPQLLLDEAKRKELSASVDNHLRRHAGRSIPKVDVPPGKAANPYACFEQYRSVKKDRKQQYLLVGSQLAISRKLLADDDEEVRRSGLAIARIACEWTSQTLRDDGLAVAIAECQLLPHLKNAHVQSWQDISRESVLRTSMAVLLQAKRFERVPVVGRELIQTSDDPNIVAFARFRIAQALSELKQYGPAIEQLEKMPSGTGLEGSKQLIAQLRRKLFEQGKE